MQNTLRKESSISGIGLHTGRNVSVTFKPDEPDSGISFVRTDLPGRPRIKADIHNVKGTVRGTTLGSITTVEHVLSALYGLSITNAVIEIDGPEPPALDGSSKPYCEMLVKAGVAAQNSPRNELKLSSPVALVSGGSSIVALPSDRFTVSFMIDYPVVFIGTQYLKIEVNRNNYLKLIAPARTFGFTSELVSLKEQGLALGANADNAVAIDEKGYLTPLRYRDELVRHKILDLIGDLSLSGTEIKAHVIGIRSGHELNVRLAKVFKEVG